MREFDALRIVQPSGREVFTFAATSDQLLQVASIPRMRRADGTELLGYQRPEVAAHIAEIRRYLESPDAVLPNTIVVAFDERVQFVADDANGGHLATHGVLRVPLVEDGEVAPGFVVDGQQRLTALHSCRALHYPVFVTALIAPDLKEQRKQFVLVNRSKPLPQGLIYELLPEIEGCLPQGLAKQRLAAKLTIRLNLDPQSSLFRRIKTPTCPTGFIKDNSIRKVLVNSLTDGALFEMGGRRNVTAADEGAMVDFVSVYWHAVGQVFDDAWDKPPSKSRLTHGAGVVSMGYIMDYIRSRTLRNQDWTSETVAAVLEPLRSYCAWTKGRWILPAGEIWEWNDPQNVDSDIRVLTNHLRRALELGNDLTRAVSTGMVPAGKEQI